MSTEDRLAEFRKQKRLTQFREMQAPVEEVVTEEVIEPAPDEGLDLQDVRGAGSAALKALTLGHGDELAGGARTFMEMLNPANYGEGTQDFADTYKMYRDDARASDREFADENPMTNLAIQAGVGIANPLNKVGWGAKAGSGLARAVGRAGLEGAAFGAGEAEELSDIPLEMGKGGLSATAVSGSLGGLGRAVGRRNVAQKLDNVDGSFTPIHMTSGDTTLGSAYRQGMGRVIGSGSKLRRQEKAILDAAKDSVEGAASKSAATTQGVKRGLSDAMDELDTVAARRAIDEAIPASVPTETVMKIHNAKTATEAEEILSAWYSKDGFKSIKGIKELEIPDNLMASVKSTLKKNPEMTELVSPAMLDGLEDLTGKTVSGGQFLEIRNHFARAANKTPSMKGKGARAFAKKFDNILKKQLGEDSPEWKAYQSELSSWGAKKALTKSAIAARKTGRDIGASDIAKTATDKSGLQKLAGAGVAEQKGLKKALSAEGLKANPRIVEAAESLGKAKDKLSTASGRKAAKGSGISELLTTSVLGGGIAPLGMAIGKGLSSKTGQRIVAGQTGLQRALKKAALDGDMDMYNRILARMAAAGQTGE